MFAVYVIAVLCLVCLSHSAPLACEALVRPLDQLDPHHLEGRWVLAAGSLSDLAHQERFKTRDSAIISFANTNETSKISFTRKFGFSDGCKYLQSNISLEGSSFVLDHFNFTVTFLHTSCSDCVLMSFNNESKKRLSLYLFNRMREVGHKDMEEFGAQAECLNMLPPVVMDPTKELCLGQVSSWEEKPEGQKA